MKKIFSILLWAIVIALSTIYTQEQYDAYRWAYKYGITTQPTIEGANLNWNITRQAFTKMVVNYLENALWISRTTSKFCFFPDEGTITSDLKPYARKTCAYDIMGKNWTKFRPSEPLTRAQLWTVLSRMIRWDKYNLEWNWYYMYHVNALKDNGIMNNISNASKIPTKRWDVIIMLKRMYDKFGSNIYLNSWRVDTVDIKSQTGTIEKKDDIKEETSASKEEADNRENSDNEYISNVYSNANVIYTWKDGTKYYYDDKLLSMLKNVAEKEWESDLAGYLEIEAEYFKKGLNQLADLDDEDLLKSMWIDTDTIDPDNMTKKEKQEFIKKFKEAFGKIIDDNKDRNDKLVKDLGKITKNIRNDKFWLEEKYEETKTFIESSNTFLDLYSESIFGLMEIALLKEDEEDSQEWMAQAFWLIWVALAYQWEAEKYQQYVEEWAVNTIKLLGLN